MLDNEQRDQLDLQYKILIKRYFDVKRIIVVAEKRDEEQRLSASAIAELRSAFDHIMRAHQVIYGTHDPVKIRNNTGHDLFEYCKENIQKAKGHLFRAGYDAYDVISISLLDDIRKFLESYSQQTIYAVDPDAANNVFSPLSEAEELCTEAKTLKDVVSHEYEKTQYELYEDAVKKLEDIKEYLEIKAHLFVNYKKEQKNIVFKNYGYQIVLGLILVAVSLFVGSFL